MASQTPRFVSIKWKLSLSLILTGLGLVVVYVIIATRVFEQDKISYVFEAQKNRLESLKREVDSRFTQALFSARSLFSTIDANHNIPESAHALFNEDPYLIGLEIWDEGGQKSIFKIEKQPGAIPPANQIDAKLAPDEVKVTKSAAQSFLFSFHPYREVNSTFIARVVIDTTNLLPQTDPLLMMQDGRLVYMAGLTTPDSALIDSMIKDFAESSEATKGWTYKKRRFLISTMNLALGGLKLLAFTPEDEALGALKVLSYQSAIFVAFSVFGLIAISLLLARGMTGNLQKLTLSAAQIGQGEFESITPIQSGDEMGILSLAFTKMSQEIKRLLQETREKARMESELKTAKLVQESLLPAKASFELNQFEIYGTILTSTECGGDWWYYFYQGKDLYIAIADATGHGTPAALITAAARSVFSKLESEKMTLAEMMKAWDFAVASCSNGQVFMTGILMRIDTLTGAGACISAGHEPPFVFTPTDQGFDQTFLNLETHLSLGDNLGKEAIEEEEFSLPPGGTLILYTDGLFTVEAPGRRFTDKRMGKIMAAKMDMIPDAIKATEYVMQLFTDHRQDLPIPDDVTVVTIRRKADSRKAELVDDSGSMTYAKS